MNHVKNVSKASVPVTEIPAQALVPLTSKKTRMISDQKLKRNVVGLRGALSKLLRLRGVSFEYNETAQGLGCPAGARMGMIAQDVEKVIPEWVQVSEHGYRELDIQGFEALAIEALREMKSENDQLRAEVAELKNLVHDLAAERQPVYVGD
jgi:hypothetical protein